MGNGNFLRKRKHTVNLNDRTNSLLWILLSPLAYFLQNKNGCKALGFGCEARRVEAVVSKFEIWGTRSVFPPETVPEPLP